MADYKYTNTSIDNQTLKDEIETTLGLTIDGVTFNEYHATDNPDNVIVHTYADLNASQQTALQNVVINHDPTLIVAKNIKIKQIDKKTQSLIYSGFTYASNVFSMSTNAQTNWLGLDHARELLTYPYGVTTINDTEYSFPDSTDLHNFFLTGMAFKGGIVSSGRSLKLQVKAATTVAEVNAIVDNR